MGLGCLLPFRSSRASGLLFLVSSSFPSCPPRTSQSFLTPTAIRQNGGMFRA